MSKVRLPGEWNSGFRGSGHPLPPACALAEKPHAGLLRSDLALVHAERNKTVALWFRRLLLLELSPRGAQPQCLCCHRAALVKCPGVGVT